MDHPGTCSVWSSVEHIHSESDVSWIWINNTLSSTLVVAEMLNNWISSNNNLTVTTYVTISRQRLVTICPSSSVNEFVLISTWLK